MEYLPHARQRLKFRNITEAEVSEALANLILEYPSRDGPNRRILIGHTKKGRELKIIVDTVDDLIVTVAPTRV